MTLFFVLSGFVIHYNYREAIAFGGASGYWRFFVARFSRLYPLFFLLMAVEIWDRGYVGLALHGDEAAAAKLVIAGPYYLTLTQSWFYRIVGDNNLIYQFSYVGSVAWSISTEWFFYAAYPLICWAALRLKGTAANLAVALLIAFAVIGTIWMIGIRIADLNAFALSHFGPIAESVPSVQDSLYRWIIYFSPYLRVGEFAVGVIACNLHLGLPRLGSQRAERRLATIGALSAITVMGVLHVAMFMPSMSNSFLTQLHMCFGFALPAALLLFCAARARGSLASCLSWRPLLVMGEASYSLYLIHIMALGYVRDVYHLDTSGFGPVGKIATMFAVLTALVAISIGSYRFIEVPARNWFRRSLEENVARRAGYRAVLATRAAVVAVTVAIPFGGGALLPTGKMSPPPDGTIHIHSATYGASCAVPPGNATKALFDACAGTRACRYGPGALPLGDPAPGCEKDFTVDYSCKLWGPEVRASLSSSARPDSQVLLNCTPAVRILSATFGGNCGAPSGNATAAVDDTCANKLACSYSPDSRVLGDPANGCSKDFSVDYTCSAGGAAEHLFIAAEAGLGNKRLQMSCLPGVRILSATYGGNCGATVGNATADVSANCSGTDHCSYTPDYRILGDPANKCEKDFSINYACSFGGAVKHLSIPAEAGLGTQQLTMSCQEEGTQTTAK